MGQPQQMGGPPGAGGGPPPGAAMAPANGVPMNSSDIQSMANNVKMPQMPQNALTGERAPGPQPIG